MGKQAVNEIRKGFGDKVALTADNSTVLLIPSHDMNGASEPTHEFLRLQFLK